MTHKITASSFLSSHYLQVKTEGVKFCEGAGARSFSFAEILCVLMAPDNTLSFQVGREVFSIPTNPSNPKHQAAIEALLQGVQALDPAGAVR